MVRHRHLLLLGLPALAGTDSTAPARRHAGCDGELTFNGICLPPTWPPRINLTHRATAPPYLAAAPAVIDITIGRQLFVDDFLVANETDGIRTVFWSPTYDAVNPVISASEPWELNSIPYYGGFASTFSGGAFWNPAKQRYELFYKCGDAFCVAYSADSVKWTKPSFDNGFKSCSHKTTSGKTSTACNMVLEHDCKSPRHCCHLG